jgi:hypothetical protein
LEAPMRMMTTLFLALAATPALAAGAQTSWGGALDPVSASLALGLGGAALWRASRRGVAA